MDKLKTSIESFMHSLRIGNTTPASLTAASVAPLTENQTGNITLSVSPGIDNLNIAPNQVTNPEQQIHVIENSKEQTEVPIRQVLAQPKKLNFNLRGQAIRNNTTLRKPR